jgi:hypothetical protein
MDKQPIWTRWGVAEIELLRRYSRISPGTHAALPFSLTLTEVVVMEGKEVGQYNLVLDALIAENARRVQHFSTIGWWLNTTAQRVLSNRGKRVDFDGDIFDFVVAKLTCGLEDRDTDSGHQRFRVLSIVWSDPRPADHPLPLDTGRTA